MKLNLKRFFPFIVNRYLVISRYVLLVLTTVIIALIYPSNNFKYDFELGRPWRYDNLYAPYTFAIQKDKKIVEEERENARKNFIPYYKIKTQVGDEVEKKFAVELATHFVELRLDSTVTVHKSDSANYYKTGIDLIEKIYRKGIINLAENHKQKFNQVYVIEKNVSSLHPIGSFYNLQQAFQIIENEINDSPNIVKGFLTPLIQSTLSPNISYDVTISDKFLAQSIADISTTKGVVQKGEEIVAQGTLIDEATFQKLLSLRSSYEEKNLSRQHPWWMFIGYLIVSALAIGIFYRFIIQIRPEVAKNNRHLSFLFILIILFLLLVRLVVSLDITLVLYAIPFGILPILLRTFMGNQLTLYAYTLVLLLSSFMLPVGLEYLFMQFVVGLVAILSTIRTYYWSQFFLSALYILLAYTFSYTGLSLIQYGTVSLGDWRIFAMFVVNAFLCLLAYPLIPLFEQLFGFVSNLTLIELSDLNKPLLKELSGKAPGTFWHSQQVANLAEAAAYEVGANTLLVKVGSLYHDIGKMEHPIYFIENQPTNINPHDELSPSDSVYYIIEHVRLGVETAKKHKLPDLVIDFIRTHHGTTTVSYFLDKYRKMYPDEKIDIKDFEYPGPLPYSKETAIVMIADSLEAASISLKNPTDLQIQQLVDNIVQGKIDSGQFVHCDLSFKDIQTIKKVMKKMLKSKFHIRVSYPKPNIAAHLSENL